MVAGILMPLGLVTGCEAPGPCLAFERTDPGRCEPNRHPSQLSVLSLDAPSVVGAETIAIDANYDAIAVHPIDGGGQRWVAADGATGRLRVGRSEGDEAPTWEAARELGGRWTSADIGENTIAMFDERTGAVELRSLDEASSLQLRVEDPSWTRMDEIVVVEGPAGSTFVLRNHFDGSEIRLGFDGVVRPVVTPGWTHVDYLRHGADVMRVEHMSLAAIGERGRLRVSVADEALAPALALADLNAERGWTQMSATSTEHGLSIAGTTSVGVDIVRINDLDVQWTRISGAMSFESIALVERDASSWLVGLRREGVEPLSAEEVDRMVTRFDELAADLPGAQFSIAQFGRVRFRGARGWAFANAQPMTAWTPIELASVSKLITATTMLRMHDLQSIELDGAFVDHLAASDYPAVHISMASVSIRDLLNMRSGLAISNCDDDDTPASVDCTRVLTRARREELCRADSEGQVCCERSYQNANYHLLRWVFAGALEARDAAAIERESKRLWMREAGLDSMFCAGSPEQSEYFSACDDATCELPGWRAHHGQPDGRCESRGWHGSSANMLRYLRALRFGWLLSGDTGHLLTEDCGTYGWTGWDPPRSGGPNRGKDGASRALGKLVSTYVARLPGEVDAVFLTNAHPVDAPARLHEIWKARVGP